MSAPNKPTGKFTESDLQAAIQALIETETEADILQLLADHPILRYKEIIEHLRITTITLGITEQWSQHMKDAMYQRINMVEATVNAFGDQIDALDGMSSPEAAPPAASRRGPALIVAAVLIGLVLLGALLALTGGGGEETQEAIPPTATPLPTTLTVGGNCTLADALLAANTGAASGGCAAGGPVTLLELAGDVILAEPYDAASSRGLPPITRTVILDGGGHAIRWAEDAPRLTFFVVERSGSLTLRRVTISGGGIGVYNLGTLNVFDSTFTDNQGGAISNSGMLTVSGSTFDHNSAAQHGGAIYNTNGGATVSNSTFSANVAGGTGGAIYSYPDSRPDLPFTITHCTFTANYAPGGFSAVDVNTFHGGGIALYNSLLVGNVDNTRETNCGSVTTGSGNIDGDGSCPGSARMDLTGLDTVLADNGGPTLTHALLQGSAAIDAGDPQRCTNGDQRGASRAGRCDAGAFEFGALAPE